MNQPERNGDCSLFSILSFGSSQEVLEKVCDGGDFDGCAIGCADGASGGKDGTSHRNNRVAVSAPAICAATNAGTSTGRIPENVSEMERATVTAGFANDVEDVNQYAAVM